MLIFQRLGLAGMMMLGACFAGALAARAQGPQHGNADITLPDGQHIANGGTIRVMASAITDSAAEPVVSAAPASARLYAATPALVHDWPDMVREAGVYALYRADVRRAAQTPPVSAEDLERVMTRLASYDGARLSLAFRAHAIMLAMQSPAFAAGVQQWGRTYDRGAIIANLRGNPAYATRIPGYQQGVTRILQAVRDEAAAIRLAGGIYKDLAYSLQQTRWASKVRHGKPLLLAEVHHAASNPPQPPDALLGVVQHDYDQALRGPAMPVVQTASAGASVRAMISPLVRSIGPGPAQAALPDEGASRPALVLNPSHEAYVQGIMASAAVQLLDRSTPYTSMASQPRGTDSFAECVDWARLHLNQCAAATHFVYEDSFCIAEHQLKDTASCLAGFTVSP